jgi:hypothetical protein
MNNRLFLTRAVMLAGLLLLLVSCTQISQPTTSATPTVDSAHLTAFAQPYPTPSPTPLGGASARLGLAPQNCPPGPTPKDVVSNTGPAVGASSVWTVGISGPHATLEWSPEQAMEFHLADGWGHKFLWVVEDSVKGLVTIHGANLRDGSPLLPSADGQVPTSTLTLLVLDAHDPHRAMYVDQWAEFPGGLTIPKAGCYYLEATWPGGSWRITFAAGVVPSNG